MNDGKIGKASLIPLSINEIVEEKDATTGSKVISSHTGEYGSLCFVVRRPGWVLCREEGIALDTLAAQEDRPLEGFGLFGVVKETGVDDKGLTEFKSKYYNQQLYRDENLTFYDSLGNRKLGVRSLSLNPLKLYKGFKSMKKRMKDKQINGNMVGEGLMKGGVIIFGKDGKAKYAYKEITGQELPTNDILDAIQRIKANN